jgi:hypothetical protein
MTFTDILTIAAITLGPGLVLLWRFLTDPAAPYRRRIKALAAAQSALRVLSSLGLMHEARREVRRAEIGILARAAFNREVRRRPGPIYLALGAWIGLTSGFCLGLIPLRPATWMGIALMFVGLVLGAFATRGIRRLLAASRPATLRAYRELCRRRGPSGQRSQPEPSPSGSVGGRQ